MGKGTVISGGPDGQYQLQISYDRAAYDAELLKLTEQITEWATKISDKNAEIITLENEYTSMVSSGFTPEALAAKKSEITKTEKEKALLTIYKLSFEKRKQYLEDNMPADETVSAWCADLTVDLTGIVGTVEIPGESTYIQIQPGHNGNSTYDETRDGVLTPTLIQTPFQAFYNLATLPGWQKWKPLFRYATITSINGDMADITLDKILSSQQSLGINQTDTLTGVSIEYMSCNGSAFEIGDDVLVKFTGQAWESPVIVGFKEEPKGCGGGYLYITIGEQCYVWDMESNSAATGIEKNNGNEADFPCLITDISDWKTKSLSICTSITTSSDYSYYKVSFILYDTYDIWCEGPDCGTSGSDKICYHEHTADQVSGILGYDSTGNTNVQATYELYALFANPGCNESVYNGEGSSTYVYPMRIKQAPTTLINVLPSVPVGDYYRSRTIGSKIEAYWEDVQAQNVEFAQEYTVSSPFSDQNIITFAYDLATDDYISNSYKTESLLGIESFPFQCSFYSEELIIKDVSDNILSTPITPSVYFFSDRDSDEVVQSDPYTTQLNPFTLPINSQLTSAIQSLVTSENVYDINISFLTG